MKLGLERFQLSGADLKIADAASHASALDFSLEELSVTDLAFRGEELSLGAIGIRGPVLRVQQSLVLGGAPQPAPTAQTAAAAPAPPAPPSAPAEVAPAAVSAAPSAQPAPGTAPADSPAPGFRVANLSIERAVFTWLAEKPIDVELHLEASGVGAQPGETFPLELGLGLPDGGEIALAGRLGLSPVSYEGKLRWHDLPVPLISVAARPELASWIRSCRAEGDLDVSLRLGEGSAAGTDAGGAAPGLHLAGRLAVHELSLADPEQKEVSLGFADLEIGVREIALPLGPASSPPAPTRIALEKVRLAAPAVLYTRPAPALDALLNPPQDGAAPPPEAPAEPAPEAGASPLELSVDTFELSSGSLRFADRSLSPPFQTEIKNLSLALRDLRWPGPHVGELRLAGVAPRQAAFTAKGSLAPEAGQLELQLDRLALSPLDFYAEPAGYRIGGGEASLHTALRLSGQRYEVDNDLVVHRLGLSSTQPGVFEQAFGMPLDVALALLRDPSGDIQLPINLAYEGTTLATDLNATVAAALRQALVGVLASPLKLVGAVLPTGGGPAELSLEPLPAVAGSAELAPGALERIAPFADVLASRPALGLVLRGRAGPADRTPLAERILIERAQAEAPLPELESAGLLARRRIVQALQARGRGEQAPLDAEDAALLARAAQAVSVPPERTAALARERAERARDLLVQEQGIDPASLVVGDPGAEGEPSVEIELTARGS